MMGRHLLALMLMMSACNAELADIPGTHVENDSGVTDGSAGDSSQGDAALPSFGTPAKHPAASSATLEEDDGSLTSDGLEMVFSIRDTTAGVKNLFYTKRASLTATWSTPTKLAINSSASDETPRFSTDDLTLYFASGRAGGAGGLDIWRATRATRGATAFATPALVPGPNSALFDKTYTPCGGSYVIVRGGDLAGGTVGAPPAPLTNLNDAATTETGPFLTKDCLRIYFASARDGTTKIYASSRTTMTAPWAAPVIATDLPMVAGATSMEDPWLSPDERILSFAANVDGTKDQYIIAR